MKKIKILDLFSGLGGFSLGLERTGHFETTAFCEIDKFCKLILDKHWKGTKIYDNVKEITKERLEADGIQFPDIITGGFPCQSFSVAGKQKGTSDSRYLWPEMFRIIKIFKPRYVIGENVRGIVNIENGMVFETVCSNLEDEGYEVQPFLIPAASVGAPHRRERIWFIASLVNPEHDGLSTSTIEGSSATSSDNNEKGQNETSEFKGTGGSRDSEIMENSRRTLQQGTELREKNENEVREENADQFERSSSPSESNVADTYARLGNGENEEIQSRGQTSNTSSARGRTDVADTTSKRLEGQLRSKLQGTRERFTDSSEKQTWWLVEPNVGRVAHGVSGRVHRLKALGNSIVPQIAEEIGKAIIKAEKNDK
tara:strand:- start:6731 stop:7840 length:1110 start_codon:yes stop_codon:yes gene_type:complete